MVIFALHFRDDFRARHIGTGVFLNLIGLAYLEWNASDDGLIQLCLALP